MSNQNEALILAAGIKLAVFDVDGVLTNGEIIYSDNFGELKVFHSHDGLGLKLLKSAGCAIAIVSSRQCEPVVRRFSELGMTEILQNQKNKADTLSRLMKKYNLSKSNIAFTGDDLADIPAMKLSGLAIAVASAHPVVKQYADWITTKPGGQGAVREICDLILKAQGKLDTITKEIAD